MKLIMIKNCVQKLQVKFLNPLSEMSSILCAADVQQKQLECTLRIVRNFGYNLSLGWSIIFVIIGNGALNHRYSQKKIYS